MSYATFAPSYTYTSPASPNAFSLFTSAHSPRDTYHTRISAQKTKTTTSGLKKIFRL
ncbi:hypothetical protein PYCCODRAFT_1468120 [Trametes coccinea BRFM310]|uniref:Uncharacterized protein n=1 Tax=Trametes coccinea (strain BRFM310) TaxID=1353009 RepID=A0A1Y2IM02_TRAC3|nr:hypothetical protein PYCCODRAFT_1468120 [Trametes coccinea BRFM310]